MKKKKIAADFLYCVGAVGMMNAVLQLIVYPVINNRVGENEFGNMLFLLGILNILAPSFGQGTANARLVPDVICNHRLLREIEQTCRLLRPQSATACNDMLSAAGSQPLGSLGHPQSVEFSGKRPVFGLASTYLSHPQRTLSPTAQVRPPLQPLPRRNPNCSFSHPASATNAVPARLHATKCVSTAQITPETCFVASQPCRNAISCSPTPRKHGWLYAIALNFAEIADDWINGHERTVSDARLRKPKPAHPSVRIQPCAAHQSRTPDISPSLRQRPTLRSRSKWHAAIRCGCRCPYAGRK